MKEGLDDLLHEIGVIMAEIFKRAPPQAGPAGAEAGRYGPRRPVLGLPTEHQTRALGRAWLGPLLPDPYRKIHVRYVNK